MSQRLHKLKFAIYYKFRLYTAITNAVETNLAKNANIPNAAQSWIYKLAKSIMWLGQAAHTQTSPLGHETLFRVFPDYFSSKFILFYK